jgi:hypothetical protein
LAALALVALVSYLVGRLGRASLGGRARGGPTRLDLLADLADPADRGGTGVATVAPLVPAEVAAARLASRQRESRVARRHYEALASEVARERRLAEYEALAGEAGRGRGFSQYGPLPSGSGGSGARVVPLHTRPATGLRRPAHH